ncbi:MAG: hypothetical protein C4334_04415 [Pyrinomonas sp.]|uniref:YceI family protein n=1 Tax=Pyrinomonas sp. TaxID=2080306 RepID=UPI003332899D
MEFRREAIESKVAEDGNEANYVFDATESRLTVKLAAAGLLSSFGHSPTLAVRKFAGEARFDPAHPERAWLRVRIRADSLEVVEGTNDRDRAEIERRTREEVLKAELHPEIIFASERIAVEKIFEGHYAARIIGDLTLCGVTRPCEIEARVLASESMLRASGEFSLRQSEFGIGPVTALGGAIKLKDELKLSFDIVARRA